jgi:hypothetical protein
MVSTKNDGDPICLGSVMVCAGISRFDIDTEYRSDHDHDGQHDGNRHGKNDNIEKSWLDQWNYLIVLQTDDGGDGDDNNDQHEWMPMLDESTVFASGFKILN